MSSNIEKDFGAFETAMAAQVAELQNELRTAKLEKDIGEAKTVSKQYCQPLCAAQVSKEETRTTEYCYLGNKKSFVVCAGD
jgi:hypothetical protein